MIDNTGNAKKFSFVDHALVFIVFLSVLPLVFTKLIPIIKLYVVWYIFFALLWVFITFAIKPSYYLRPSSYRIIVFLLLAITLLFPLFDANYTLVNKFVGFSSFFMYYFFYDFNCVTKRNHVSYRVIYMLLPFFVYTSISTIIALETSPYISRRIKSAGSETLEIYSSGVGGYDFIYSAVILFPTLLYLSIKKSSMSLVRRLSLFVLMFVCLVLIVKSNYFTALVTALLTGMIVLTFFIWDSKYRIAYLFGLFIMALTFAGLLMSITTWINTAFDIVDNYFGNAIGSERIKAIFSYLAYGSDPSSILGRQGLLSYGVDKAIENLPFGLAFSFKSHEALSIISNHSYVFDMLALFGVFGFVYIFYLYYPYIIRINKDKSGVLFSVFIGFLVISVFNNLSSLIAFQFFYVTLFLSDNKLTS